MFLFNDYMYNMMFLSIITLIEINVLVKINFANKIIVVIKYNKQYHPKMLLDSLRQYTLPMRNKTLFLYILISVFQWPLMNKGGILLPSIAQFLIQ